MTIISGYTLRKSSIFGSSATAGAAAAPSAAAASTAARRPAALARDGVASSRGESTQPSWKAMGKLSWLVVSIPLKNII